MKTYAGGLKRGEFVNHQGSIWQITKTEFYSPGKGSALMHTKLKNVATGKTVDYAFKSNEDVETVEVNSIEMQYMYKDEDNLYFMNEQTYDQMSVPVSMAEGFVQYLKEGDKLYVFVHEDKALSVRAPLTVRLKVTETEDAVKGDTVTNARKPATTETGATIMVPLFVKAGEIVTINPETGEYVGRA
ncbi:MAG: elongation factor P [Patescibacteria group bacterium]